MEIGQGPWIKIFWIDTSVYLLSIVWKWQQDFLSQQFIHKMELQQYRLNLLGFYYFLSMCDLQSTSHKVFFAIYFFILPSVFCSIAWIPILVTICLISVAWVLLVSIVTLRGTFIPPPTHQRPLRLSKGCPVTGVQCSKVGMWKGYLFSMKGT